MHLDNQTEMENSGNKYFVYLGLVLIFSIPFYLLNLVYKEGILINLPISFLMILVPFFLAFYFSYKESGIQGIKLLLIESHQVKKGKGLWLLLSLVIAFLLFTIAAVIDSGIDQPIYQAMTVPYIGLLLLLYLGAWVEEVGWTTYLSKGMQEKYGVLKTGLMIGFVWGLWHLFPYISQGKSWQDITLLIGLAVLYRIMMGYLYAYASYTSLTGILFHTMINFLPELMVKGYGTYTFLTLFFVIIFFTLIIIFLDKRLFKRKT